MWLFDLLAREGLAAEGRLEMIYGGMPNDQRERFKAAFQTHPKESAVRILLATDAASEGVNLQNHCSRLIHFEIPWNPTRMEQRNGRVDRHGQRACEVDIYHFVGRGFDTARVHRRLTTPLDWRPQLPGIGGGTGLSIRTKRPGAPARIRPRLSRLHLSR
jgi:superfamily II DNA/RNA helicase